jgi:hypothetical protein
MCTLNRLNKELTGTDKIRFFIQIVLTCVVGPIISYIYLRTNDIENHVIMTGLTTASIAIAEATMTRVLIKIPFSFPSTPMFVFLFGSVGGFLSFLYRRATTRNPNEPAPYVICLSLSLSLSLSLCDSTNHLHYSGTGLNF